MENDENNNEASKEKSESDKNKSKEEEEEEEEEENEDNNNVNIKDNNNNIETTAAEGDEEFFSKLVFSKYKLIKKLGEGSFGKVYKAEYNSKYYAIKFEQREGGQDLLKNEATIISYLKGNPHIPKAHSYGFSGNYNIFVLQLLAKSLEDVFNERQKFSLKTGAMLAFQMIEVLKYIHSKHIIHRDIKPDNFVLGSDEYNAYLYLVDFGLAKKYRSSKTLKQNPYMKKKKLTGTARYASIHAMEEMEQSRRDDLEAVSYVIMYFIRGNLPWQGLKLKSNEDRYQKILEKKKEISTEELCAEYPKVFYEFVKYSKGLKYSEEPKYDELKKNFVDWVVNQKKEKFDYIYDWTTKEDIKKRKEEFNITCENLDENNNGKKRKSKIEEKEGEGSNNNEDKENKKKESVQNKDKLEDRDKEIENKTEKVESQCCIMYVHIIFNFLIL
jgi:serine/threonine protein kinase